MIHMTICEIHEPCQPLLKGKLTYWDLDPGVSRNPMMWRWNSQITSDCDQQYLNPSHPLSPSPPTSQGLLPLLIPSPLSPSSLSPAHGHTGVFHNNFLWYKLLALICIINPFSAFASGIVFSHNSRNTSLPKNVLFLCRTIFWEILFPALLILHFLFDKPMPITYFEGINAPVTLLGHCPWFYKGKGRWVMISNNDLWLSHGTLPTSNF